MHGKLASLFLAAALAGMSSTAFAMPGQPVHVGGATASDDTAPVIKVANGCGPGGYRGPYGACHAYGTGPFRADITGCSATTGAGTAALRASGAALGAIAVTRPTTAACPAAAGNSRLGL